MRFFLPRRLVVALVPLLFTAAAMVSGQSVHTPAKDSPERKAIMDAVRVPCEKDLRQKVIFTVQKLTVTQGWAYAAVTPLTPDGGKIDYLATKFKAQAKSGDFEPTGEALLRLQDDSWQVLKWRLGGTDVALLEWIESEGAPKSLDSGEEAEAPAAAAPKAAGNAPGLKAFLLDPPGANGWSPVEGSLSYDFLPDGRLHIQGPDGEATMWEGKWRLQGDQLTLINSDKKTTETVTAAKQGADLLLDGEKYRRDRP